MKFGEIVERLSKLSTGISDLAKGVLTFTLAIVVVGAVAAPERLKGHLGKMGLEISKINLPFVTLEQSKASAGSVQVAESIRQADLQLAHLTPDQAEPIRNQLRTAMRALNAQNDAMFAAAEGAGLKIDAPATGWLRVGLFSESGQEVKLSDRMDRAGLKYDGRKQLTAVKLKFDAQVIADGDNCASIKIEDAKPIAAPAPGAKTLVMRADELPIEVLDVAECTMRSGVRDRYVRVRTPATRLRYAEFKSMGA